MKQDLNRLLAQHCKTSLEKVRTDTERDYFLSAEEAQKYGIIDKVLTNRKELAEGK